jgi:hypothetical protein
MYHMIMAYKMHEGTDLHLLDPGSGWCVVNFMLQLLYPRWIPESLDMAAKRKIPAPAGNLIPLVQSIMSL